MKVKGERFYDMVNRNKAKFGLPNVLEIVLQECIIDRVDEFEKVLDTTHVWIVIVALDDMRMVATKPLTDQDHAAMVAHTLASRVEEFTRKN